MTPSPETHVFIGMFRPPWEEVRKNPPDKIEPRWVLHPDNPMLLVKIGGSQHREKWQRGDYDTPVYRTHEEVVKMRNEA